MIQFKETFFQVLRYIRQYKLRTFMTMFGLIWGTMTVILLLAFGVGLKKAMSKNMHGMGDGIAIMWPGSTSIPYNGYGRDRRIRFHADDIPILRREIPEIKYISQEYSEWGIPVRVGDKVNKTSVAGIIPEYGPMRNVWPQPGGRWLHDPDIKDRKRVAFIGNKLKDLLFGEQTNAVGKYIMIGDSPFMVIGVLRKKTQPSCYTTRDQDRVYIPASTFESFFGHRYLANIVYKLHDPTKNEYVENRLNQVYAKMYVFDPTDKETLHIWDTTEMDKFIHYFSLGFNIFMGVIGVFTLIVGGIGLANIMYVVVQERTREIGVKRAVGAKRTHIMSQLIQETFIILGFGAFLGFMLAVLLIKAISLFPLKDIVGHPELSWSVAIISSLILVLIGFIAGFFPARKAARLNVVDCLRF